MSDLLQKGSNWLEDMRHQHASQPVTYIRETLSVQLNATLGKTTYEVEDENGLTVQAETMDVLIRVTDLILGGLAVLPLPGDQIQIIRDSTVVTFEVMALGNQGHYRYSDAGGRTVRIHTRQVNAE